MPDQFLSGLLDPGAAAGAPDAPSPAAVPAGDFLGGLLGPRPGEREQVAAEAEGRRRHSILAGVLDEQGRKAANYIRTPAYPVPDEERYRPAVEELGRRLQEEAPWLDEGRRQGIINEFQASAPKVAGAADYERSFANSLDAFKLKEGQKGFYERFAEKGGVIPFAGKLGDIADAMEEKQAKERIEAGRARPDDYLVLGHLHAKKAAAAGQTTWQQTQDIAAGLPSFLMEWGAFSPLTGPAKGWAAASAAKYAGPAAGKVAGPLAGAAAAGAARTALNVPEAVLGVEQRQAEGQSLGGAVARTYRDEFIKNSVFEGLNPFEKKLGDAAWQRVGKGLASAMTANEAAADLTAAFGADAKKIGPFARLVTADTDEERERAWTSIKAQLLAFGGLETLLNVRGDIHDAQADLRRRGINPDPRMLQEVIFDQLAAEANTPPPPERQLGWTSYPPAGPAPGLEALPPAQSAAPAPSSIPGGLPPSTQDVSGRQRPAQAAENGPPSPSAAAEGPLPSGTPTASPAQSQAPSRPLSPREQADALAQQHNDLQARLLDVQKAERQLLKESQAGFNREGERKAARQERLSLQEQIGGKGWVPGKAPKPDSLMDQLDKARMTAAAAGPAAPPPAAAGPPHATSPQDVHEAILRGGREPPVAAGMVRLYRGESSDPSARQAGGLTGGFWTTDRREAEGEYGDRVYYADVPRSKAPGVGHVLAGTPEQMGARLLSPGWYDLGPDEKTRLKVHDAIEDENHDKAAALYRDSVGTPPPPGRSGPPAPEPGTGIINPVQTGVPGIVSGAVEVPLERPTTGPAASGQGAPPPAERALENMRRRQRGLSPLPPAPREPVLQPVATPQPEPLTRPEAKEQSRAARARYEDIPATLRRQIEVLEAAARPAQKVEFPQHEGPVFAALRALREGGEQSVLGGLRETARVAYARGGEEGVRELIALEHERQNPPEASPENLAQAEAEWRSAMEELSHGVEQAVRGLQRRGHAPGSARAAVAQRVREATAHAQAVDPRAADAAGAGPSEPAPTPARPPRNTGLSEPPATDLREELARRQQARDLASEHYARATEEWQRQTALRTEVLGRLRRFGEKAANLVGRNKAHLDADAVKNLDSLAMSYAENEPEKFGDDATRAADRIFELITQPRPEKPSLERSQRIAEDLIHQQAEAERGEAYEFAGATAGEPTEIEPGVLFNSSLASAAKYPPVSPDQARKILRSGRPTPQLTEGQRSLLEEHLLRGKSLAEIARNRGFSSANAGMTYKIALRNLGAPEWARTNPRARFTPGTRPGVIKTVQELHERLLSDEPLPGLSPEEEVILRARLGPEPRSGEDVARELGVTRAAVSARYQSVIKKLQLAGLSAEAGVPRGEEPGREVSRPERGELTARKSAGAYDAAKGFTYERATEELADAYMRRIADAGSPITAEERAYFNSELSRLSREERSGAGGGPALHDAFLRHREARQAGEAPGLLYHTGGTQGGAGQAGAGPGPFEVNATIDRLLDVANYNVKNIPENKNASAATKLHEESVRTLKLHAGDPEIRLEEAAHIIAGRLGFEVDPARLAPDVAEGLRQFFNPAAPLNSTTMHEGLGQWLVRRAAGQLQALTPQQRAASDYAEAWVRLHGLAEPLDRVGDVYRQYRGQSPAQQYAGTISKTGEPAAPVGLTTAERSRGLARRFVDRAQERVENKHAVLGRMEADAVAKGMPERPEDERAMNVALAFQHQGGSWARHFAENGVPYVQPDGSWKPASKSAKDVTAPLKPGEEDAFDAFAKAREAADVFQREELAAAAARRAGQAPEKPTVAPEQAREAMGVLQDMLRANPEQFQRFNQVNEDRAAVLTQGLRFLEQIGRLAPGTADRWAAKNPYYLSRAHVFDRMTEDYLDQKRGGGRGAAGFEKRRGQSGEQTRPALDTFRERLSDLGWLAQKQIRDAAVRDVLRQKGMGNWAREMEPGGRPDGRGGETVREPDDDTKPVWYSREAGREVRFMMYDKALADYLLNRQADSSRVARLANVLAEVPVLNLAPKVESLLATTASPLWHFREMHPLRGPKTFLQNTINRASAAQLPELYARWPQFLLSGKLPEGHYLAPYMALYERLAGHSQRWITQGRDPGETIGRMPAFVQEALKRLSYPETAPRVLELKNKLDSMNIDAATVEGWNRAGVLPDPKTQAAVLRASAEVGHNYQRAGIDTEALQKLIPFARAHVANTSKWVRNWRDNPTGAALGLGLLVAARVAYNLGNKDDEDFKEKSVGLRGKMYGLAGARGPDAVADALVDESLRWATNSNPHPERVGEKALEMLVPGGPEPYSTAGKLVGNRQQMMGLAGRPVVPPSAAGESALSNAWHYQAPFAAERLTAGAASGRTPANLATLGFYSPGTPHQSVEDYYEALRAVEARRTQARRRGLNYPGEAEYRRLKAAEKPMAELNKALRADPSREAEVRRRQIDLARHALGR